MCKIVGRRSVKSVILVILVVVTLEERWLLESLKNLCFLLRFSTLIEDQHQQDGAESGFWNYVSFPSYLP